jgi:hypothetical protein
LCLASADAFPNTFPHTCNKNTHTHIPPVNTVFPIAAWIHTSMYIFYAQ